MIEFKIQENIKIKVENSTFGDGGDWVLFVVL